MSAVGTEHGSLRPLIGRGAVVTMLAVTAALGAAFVGTLAVHRFAFEITDTKLAFDLGQERNVPTWWNTVLLAGISGVLLLAAALHPAGAVPSRRSLVVAAVAAGALSVDEAAQLHELSGAPTETLLDGFGITVPTYAWVVPGAIVGLAGFVAFLAWRRALPPPVARATTLALGMYATGALGVEAINGWLRERDLEYAYVAGTLLEETLEMSACVLAIHGFGRLLVLHGAGRGPSLRRVEAPDAPAPLTGGPSWPTR